MPFPMEGNEESKMDSIMRKGMLHLEEEKEYMLLLQHVRSRPNESTVLEPSRDLLESLYTQTYEMSRHADPYVRRA